MIDPRLYVVNERLSRVGTILAVASGKGGVGKTLISSALALALRDLGLKVGLLDLDVNCPNCHIILGVKEGLPKEERGILPIEVNGLSFLSVYPFVGRRALPLRGGEKVSAITEMLAVTKWPKLNYLIMDLPPGTDDELLEVIKSIDNVNFLVVTTPSQLSFESVTRLVGILKERKARIKGLIGNMVKSVEEMRRVEGFAYELGVELIATISYDLYIEQALGNLTTFKSTNFFKEVLKLARKLKP